MPRGLILIMGGALNAAIKREPETKPLNGQLVSNTGARCFEGEVLTDEVGGKPAWQPQPLDFKSTN